MVQRRKFRVDQFRADQLRAVAGVARQMNETSSERGSLDISFD